MTPACGFKWPKSGCFLQDKNKPKEVRRWCKRMKTQNNNSSIPVTPSHTGTSWWSGRGSRPDTSPPPESHKNTFSPRSIHRGILSSSVCTWEKAMPKVTPAMIPTLFSRKETTSSKQPWRNRTAAISTKLHLYRCSKCAFLLTCLWTFPAASVAFFKSSLLQLEKLMQQLVGMPLTEKYRVLNQLV